METTYYVFSNQLFEVNGHEITVHTWGEEPIVHSYCVNEILKVNSITVSESSYVFQTLVIEGCNYHSFWTNEDNETLWVMRRTQSKHDLGIKITKFVDFSVKDVFHGKNHCLVSDGQKYYARGNNFFGAFGGNHQPHHFDTWIELDLSILPEFPKCKVGNFCTVFYTKDTVYVSGKFNNKCYNLENVGSLNEMETIQFLETEQGQYLISLAPNSIHFFETCQTYLCEHILTEYTFGHNILINKNMEVLKFTTKEYDHYIRHDPMPVNEETESLYKTDYEIYPGPFFKNNYLFWLIDKENHVIYRLYVDDLLTSFGILKSGTDSPEANDMNMTPQLMNDGDSDSNEENNENDDSDSSEENFSDNEENGKSDRTFNDYLYYIVTAPIYWFVNKFFWVTSNDD